jgi:predicted acylesterase/phospholipase RssA
MNSQTPQYCDVIMKGGLTSGIVYPLAIDELAKTYQFKNIGGTSAGAIAAAVAAAAEYRRRTTGSHDGFAQLGQIPNDLSEGALLRLFQPQLATRSLFALLLAFIGNRHWSLKLAKALVLLFVYFPIGAVVGALPGLAVLIYLKLNLVQSFPFWVWLTLVVFLIVLPAFLLALLNVVVQALWAIPANNYGLCGGSGGESDNKALTDWLADKLKSVAGHDLLTFKDLWSAGGHVAQPGDEHAINLEMMTTNVTFGRPNRLPMNEDELHLFYFRESEFEHLFSKEIVNYLKQAKPHGRRDEKHWHLMAPEYFPFPKGEDLPVIVATRMSLSFPILISAIPLYTFDWSLEENREAMKSGKRPILDKCLFSDGGISSNFPIHFFDGPVPRWPTFAITLSSSDVVNPDQIDESSMVSMSHCNRPNQAEDFNRFDEHWWRLAGFLGAILNTLRNWRDQTQARVPGYRDRIATIHLTRNEGGINLNMPTDVIARLSKRGQQAGKRLRQRFNPEEGDGSGLNWQNQRWIRYRSFMAVFETLLAKFKRGFEFPQQSGVPSYAEMVEAGGIEDKTQHCGPGDKSPFDHSQQSGAQLKTQQLFELATEWAENAETFAPGSPKPPADLVIRPKV